MSNVGLLHSTKLIFTKVKYISRERIRDSTNIKVKWHSPASLNKTAAEAKVACPHKETSVVGVNHRKPNEGAKRHKHYGH